MNNKLTQKQKKILLICLGIVVASYVVKWVYTAAQQAAFLQQQANRAAQQRAKAKADAAGRGSTPTVKLPPKPGLPPVTVLTDLSNLSGMWMGQRLLNANGLCTMRLEMRPILETPQNYKGYARLNCMPPPGLVSLRGGRVLPRQQRENLNPVAMVPAIDLLTNLRDHRRELFGSFRMRCGRIASVRVVEINVDPLPSPAAVVILAVRHS